LTDTPDPCAACGTGQLCCNDACVDESETNCGSCGVSCGDNSCVSSVCVEFCGPSMTVCGAGQECCQDACVPVGDASCACTVDADCATQEHCCGGGCVARTSTEHCASCDNACVAG